MTKSCQHTCLLFFSVEIIDKQFFLILWTHHCSWGTNFRGFLPTNLHPHESLHNHVFIKLDLNKENSQQKAIDRKQNQTLINVTGEP